MTVNIFISVVHLVWISHLKKKNLFQFCLLKHVKIVKKRIYEQSVTDGQLNDTVGYVLQFFAAAIDQVQNILKSYAVQQFVCLLYDFFSDSCNKLWLDFFEEFWRQV